MKPLHVMAEIGSTWRVDSQERSHQLALNAITEAAQAGATAVKVQVFCADSLYSQRRAYRHWLNAARYELPLAWLPEMAELAHRQELVFWASVFAPDLVGQVAPYVDGLKVASGDLTYTLLVDEMVEQANTWHLPLAFSTGAATQDEVGDLLERVHERYEGPGITLLECVSAYPAHAYDYNLRGGTIFGDTVDEIGLSDHTRDSVLPAQLAVALGYTVFEKHFRPQGADPHNPDYAVAVDGEQLAHYVKALHGARAIVGDWRKYPKPCELDERTWARRGGDGLRPTEDGHE